MEFNPFNLKLPLTDDPFNTGQLTGHDELQCRGDVGFVYFGVYTAEGIAKARVSSTFVHRSFELASRITTRVLKGERDGYGSFESVLGWRSETEVLV